MQAVRLWLFSKRGAPSALVAGALAAAALSVARYQWREIDPVNDQDGGQPGGNNLRPSYSIHAIDPNGSTRDIYLWNSRGHGGAGNVSRESRPGVKDEFNGPSVAPAISSHGNYLAFASDEVGQLDGDGPALPNILMRFLGGK